MTATADRDAAPATRDGFAQVLRGEWTKLRSVRSTAWCLVLAIVLTALLSMLAAAGSTTDANDGPRYLDRLHFVHQPLSGDGTVTARVVSQRDTDPWARAGILLKASTMPGSQYAAIMVTPDHGVRMQSGFTTEVSGGPGTAPRWLRLVRSDSSVTGQQSADGRTWTTVGTVDVPSLPSRAEAGLFVTSPGFRVARRGASTGPMWTLGAATFTDVGVTAAGRPLTGRWADDDVGGAAQNVDGTTLPGGSTRTANTITVTGSGDLRALRPGEPGDNDIVRDALSGAYIGLVAIVTLGVMFATSEYKTGIVRTTFAASPRRGRVLAAKAIVLGSVVFLAGLAGSVAAFYLTQPLLRRNGFEPPAYPHPSLTEGPVLRAVAGTALFLAMMSLFALGVGAILRRSAGAITLVLALVLVPGIAAGFLPIDTERWVHRLTPLAGLAVQQTRDRFDNAIGPWAGMGVLCAYVAIVLGAGLWTLRRRDA